MNNKELLEKLYAGKDLSSGEIQFLLQNCINDGLTNSQIAAFLIALRMKDETVEEVSGLIQGMREHMIALPGISYAIDTCGTGGDGSGTFNISTTVAFVVAGAGVPVVKHGNKAASSQCGSADVLSELGVAIFLRPEQAKKVFEKVGMVFLFAPIYHTAMKRIAPIRKDLGTRTVFNFLGPFLNPASVKRQLIGVPDEDLAEKLAQVAARLGYDLLFLISNTEGMDEIGLHSKTVLFEIKGKKISKKIIDPQKLGFGKVSLEGIQGGNVSENALITRDILSGTQSAKRDIVVLNSAYALLVAGKVNKIFDGIKLAEQSIDSGAANTVLNKLIKETQKYAK